MLYTSIVDNGQIITEYNESKESLEESVIKILKNNNNYQLINFYVVPSGGKDFFFLNSNSIKNHTVCGVANPNQDNRRILALLQRIEKNYLILMTSKKEIKNNMIKLMMKFVREYNENFWENKMESINENLQNVIEEKQSLLSESIERDYTINGIFEKSSNLKNDSNDFFFKSKKKFTKAKGYCFLKILSGFLIILLTYIILSNIFSFFEKNKK